MHPRERGGADLSLSTWTGTTGASARTRRRPSTAARPRTDCRVHPRERGGAAQVFHRWMTNLGASARTRRSRPRLLRARGKPGCIRANAEEPAATPDMRGGRGVHPRERGGAPMAVTLAMLPWGASARTRRSRRDPLVERALGGCIRANAEEPLQAKPLLHHDFKDQTSEQVLRTATYPRISPASP